MHTLRFPAPRKPKRKKMRRILDVSYPPSDKTTHLVVEIEAPKKLCKRVKVRVLRAVS